MGQKNQIGALQRDAERFGELVRICPNGIAICSGTTVRSVNPALSQLVDFPAEELVGRSLADLLFESVRERTMNRLQTMLAEGMGHDSVCSTRLQRADGLTIDVEASTDRLESGEAVDSVVVFRPLAVFRNTALLNSEELIQRAHLLRMSVFGELAAALIHELGQPLTAARGASDILESTRNDDGTWNITGRPAEILMTAVGQIGDRFQKIWQFVRNRRPELTSVPINASVQDAIDLTTAAARHAAVDVQFSAGDVQTVNIDSSLIGLVTTGLIRRSVTALQASVGKPRLIRVTTSDCPGEFVAVEIEHNGAVMATEESGTAPTVPLESTPDHLALSTYRLIVEEHGGILNIQPGIGGVGVRYRLLLPGG